MFSEKGLFLYFLIFLKNKQAKKNNQKTYKKYAHKNTNKYTTQYKKKIK